MYAIRAIALIAFLLKMHHAMNYGQHIPPLTELQVSSRASRIIASQVGRLVRHVAEARVGARYRLLSFHMTIAFILSLRPLSLSDIISRIHALIRAFVGHYRRASGCAAARGFRPMPLTPCIPPGRASSIFEAVAIASYSLSARRRATFAPLISRYTQHCHIGRQRDVADAISFRIYRPS